MAHETSGGCNCRLAELLCQARLSSVIRSDKTRLCRLQVRLIEEAKDRLRKIQKDAARTKAANKLPVTETQARLRAQMEADRRERQARGPVSHGSVAQALPSNNGITTARDVGIGDDDHHPEH